ncbi:hypothetical protein J2Z21_000970 [Streptomyces griseochromogenes]|uniref:Uncharacterized protein n=1 Tax=Streptomyces griseochromogenes TaxID=68214 RepID=A0ABS4LLG5_9ACTN|nr:hypothetical protein [Streptomyces griseochromogenes]
MPMTLFEAGIRWKAVTIDRRTAAMRRYGRTRVTPGAPK